MSDENKKDPSEDTGAEAEAATTPEEPTKPKQDGPTFNEAPDPMASVKKSAEGVWNSMEGKTVSMRVYVGSIIGVIILMLLARCGG